VLQKCNKYGYVALMGTILNRKKKDGSTSYTASIRLKRDGLIYHSETETFEEKANAKSWLRRRETELEAQKSRGESFGKAPTLAELIDWYRTELKKHTGWGRTKEADLKRLGGYPISTKICTKLTASDFINHINYRRDEGAGSATAANDLIWLRQVLKSGRASKNLSINLQALDDAGHELRTRKVIAKPKKRARRLTGAEEDRLLGYFKRRDMRSLIPMTDIMLFVLISARRQDEVTQIRWKDLDEKNGIYRLYDLKHPTRKIGNDKSARLINAGWQIINRQPKTSEFVFPYNSKSIGAAFTRCCQLLEIEDLHFHDLRHEATSRLFEAGYSITEVCQFTLHDSWSTLQRYTHLRPENVPERPMSPALRLVKS
jgi:integrase